MEASAEFRYILDQRGIDPFSPIRPLAHLGLARAFVVSGDDEKAAQSYEDFFTLWKDADSDLPVLIEAKREFAKLKAKKDRRGALAASFGCWKTVSAAEFILRK